MTSTRNFDYDEYMRSFRAACARRGIDPQQGASGYQVVHITAERHKAAHTPDRWWQRHELWIDDCLPDHSDTEKDAIWHVFGEAYLITMLHIVRAKRLRRAALALRELHQQQQPRQINRGN